MEISGPDGRTRTDRLTAEIFAVLADIGTCVARPVNSRNFA